MPTINPTEQKAPEQTPAATTIPDVTPRPLFEDAGEGMGIGFSENGEIQDRSVTTPATAPATEAPADHPPASSEVPPAQIPQSSQPSFSPEIAQQLTQGAQAQKMLSQLFRDHGERIIPLLRGEDPNAQKVDVAAQMARENETTRAKCKELFGDAGDQVAEFVNSVSEQRARSLIATEMNPLRAQIESLNSYYVQQQCRELAGNWQQALVAKYNFPPAEATEVISAVINHESTRGMNPQQLHAAIQNVLLEYLPGRQTAPVASTVPPQGAQPPGTQVPRTRLAAELAPSASMRDMRRAGALVTGSGAPGDSALPTDQRSLDLRILRESQGYGGFGGR